jgi:hypothetical protein
VVRGGGIEELVPEVFVLNPKENEGDGAEKDELAGQVD